MKRSLLVVSGTLLSSLWLAGCASAPAISAGSASSGARNEHGQEILVTLVVRNTTDELIPLRTVHYTLELDGVTVFTGTRAAEVTLGPSDTRELKLPAVIPFAHADADASPADGTPTDFRDLSQGSRTYRLTGTLTYLTPGAFAETLYDLNVRVPKESFAVQGEIALP